MDDSMTPQGEPLQPPAVSPTEPPTEAPSGLPTLLPQAPTPKVKPKTDVVFFILGLFAPYVVLGLLGALGAALSNAMTYNEVTGPLLGLLSVALNSITPLLFFAFLAAWMIGRKNGNIKLASFGKGGMWAYAVGALLALLAFGTCLVALGSGGL